MNHSRLEIFSYKQCLSSLPIIPVATTKDLPSQKKHILTAPLQGRESLVNQQYTSPPIVPTPPQLPPTIWTPQEEFKLKPTSPCPKITPHIKKPPLALHHLMDYNSKALKE